MECDLMNQSEFWHTNTTSVTQEKDLNHTHTHTLQTLHYDHRKQSEIFGESLVRAELLLIVRLL